MLRVLLLRREEIQCLHSLKIRLRCQEQELIVKVTQTSRRYMENIAASVCYEG